MEENQAGKTPDTAGTTEAKGSTLARNIGIGVAVLVILAIIGASIYGMVNNPGFTAVLRDVSIIALALVTVVIGLFLVILIFQLQSLIALLRNEIKPLLDSAKETASTVRGTTTFVSDAVVTPMIEAAGYAAAVRQVIRTLFGNHRNKGHRRVRREGSPRS